MFFHSSGQFGGFNQVLFNEEKDASQISEIVLLTVVLPMRKEYDSDCWVSPDANYHNVIASLSLGGIARCNLVFFYSILGPTNSGKCSNRSGVRQNYKKKHSQSSFKSGKGV